MGHKFKWVGLVILATAVALPLQPLLTGHLPWQGDGLLHFYRLGALANAVDWTWLYPRWLPDLALGAGFPLFNYYAPLSTYVALPLYLLGLTAGAAMRLSYAGAYLTLTGATAGWSRHNGWGWWGALAASAPYVAINLYQRAALAELWGLALFVLSLWLVQRLVERPCRRRLVTAGSGFALLVIAHNITALIGTPFIIGLALWTRQKYDGLGWPWRLSWLPFGLAVSAFFWVPAIFESDLVQLGRLTDSSNFSYVNHFLSWRTWLAWPPPADPDLINPPLPLAVGWGQLTLALIGVGVLAQRFLAGQVPEVWRFPLAKDEGEEPDPSTGSGAFAFRISYFVRRWLVTSTSSGTLQEDDADRVPVEQAFVPTTSDVYFNSASPVELNRQGWMALGLFLAALLSLIMTVEFSSGLWSLVPGLSFVQFPWRFLGPAAVFLAMINAFALHALWQTRARWGKTAALLLPLLIIVQQLPYLFPSPQPNVPARISPADLNAFEQQTGWLGTTSAADYLPVTASVPTTQNERPSFDGRTLILPADPEEGKQLLPQLDFPGWRVEIGGQPVEHATDPATGLITVEPPTAAQTITLMYRGTPLQRAMTWLSLLTLSLTAVAAVRGRNPFKKPRLRLNYPPTIAIIAAAAAAILLKTVVLDRVDFPLRQSRYDGTAVAGVPPLRANFGGRLELIGAMVPQPPHAADQPLEIDLFWRGLAFDQEVSVAVHLIDGDGIRVAQSDAFHPADFPLPRWRPDQYARDHHTLFLPAASPPGDYTLRLLVTDPAGVQQEHLDRSGRPLSTALDLATIPITPAGRPPTRSDVTPATWLDSPLSPAVTVLGVDQGIRGAAPGDAIFMSIYWEAQQNDPPPPQGEIVLTDTEGAVWQSAPLGDDIPGPGWRAREVRRSREAVRLPAALPTGRYRITLDGLLLSEFDVNAPERLFDQPDFAIPLDNSVGDAAVLLGATVNCAIDAQTCAVRLVWQAMAEMETGYQVFVQLLGPDGRPVAQSDHTPTHQQENRPTTSWLPGEYLIDSHTLNLPADLPAGSYALITGLYNPTTGDRLPTREGDTVTVLIIDN